jgi:aminomethyltransferase
MNTTVERSGVETIEVAGQTIPWHFGDPETEYRAALAGAVAVPRTHEGRVRAVGRDRLELMQRMSTNDMLSLPAGQARDTVLTTAIGRIVDLLRVLNLGESALLLTGAGRAQAVRRWLSGYIFFRDEVRLPDASGELGQINLYGPKAGAVADALLSGAGSLTEDHFLEREDLIVLRGRPLAGDGFTLIAPSAQIEALWARALAAGAVAAGEQAYQWLRLAAGRPEAGHELTEDYIPLEADLWPAVDFQKGCYIGQEIIARMESRGKLARRLAGLRLDAPVAEGAEVRVAEATAGSVTSAGVVPDLGPVALAYLRTGLCEPGTRVRVGGEGASVTGGVAPIPFR